MPNEREVAETELALLIRDANAAATPPEKARALTALENFSERTLFPDLGEQADTAAAITAAQTREEAISKMRQSLNTISAIDAAFKSAAQIAADGEQHLFFPRLASTLGQVETILTTLKEQFDAVAANINSMKSGIDLAKLKGLADSVKSAADTLTQKLDTL